jgi:hypothetical protein
VKTENGQNFANAVGVKEPPMTIEQSVKGVLAQVCAIRDHSLIIATDRDWYRLTLLKRRRYLLAHS